MPHYQSAGNSTARDGLFLCLRSFLLKHENSRNKSRKLQYLEVLLVHKTLKSSVSCRSMHTEIVKKVQKFQDVEVFFCMREGGSSPYCEVAQVLFVENGNSWKILPKLPSNWRHSRRFENCRKNRNLLIRGCLMSSGCVNAAMLTTSQTFQYLSSFGHRHFLLIL